MEKRCYFMVRNHAVAKFHTCMCVACLLLGGRVRLDRVRLYLELPDGVTWHRLVMGAYAELSRWSFGELMHRRYILHDAKTQALIEFHLSDDGRGFNYYVAEYA